MELKKLISQFVLVITACLLVAPKWLSADDEPFLRIEAGGPQSYVTALAFDPTGTTIYAAGWDKVVRVWHRDPANGKWVIDENSTLRLPIGPGLFGSINAMTVSDDGRWLAVGGHGIFRAGASFRQPGRVVPSEGFLTTEMRRDEGLIYVFDIRETRVHLLRGHAGSIVSLAFAPGDETPVLVSAAREWQDKQNGSGRFVGLLKVWDVLHPKDQDSSIASLELPDPKTRPGLAIRRTGSGLTQFEVAIGWGDEHFRIWNVTKKTVEDVACEKNGNTVALSADASGFITGVVGQLEFRKPGRPPEAISLRVGNEFVYPRALARGGSQSGQVVAVASRVLDPSGRPRSPDRFVLQVARSNDRKIGAPSGPCLLWEVSATGALPTVALSPDGEVAALAGGADHSIWIYRTQDIRPGGNPVQILKNSGRNWRQVSFVNKDQHRGMALKSASGELVFDLVEQAAVKDTKGWKSNSASAGDWRIDPRREGEVSVVVISRGNREVSRAILPEGESVSAHAFLPNVEPNANRPTMVAIASQLIGQASLRLFNAETGETFRELTGHTEVIRSLSFEAGGRLLASVAGDQVVCVWDLADIDAILGERGMLPGVAVRGGDGDRQGEISIATIRETAPASIRGKFFAKDVLQGVTIDGKQQSWSTPREFSDVLWSIKPGTQANFSVNRQGRMTEVLTAVGQGIDERKPMLSFFFPNAEDQRTDWIAWTPLGPYEASDRSVERFLGWHFNIGDAIQVTKFAPASDYRKTYYRDGLVKELIEKGNLPKRQVPRPTAVNIRFGPEAQQELTSGETVHIRQKPRTFHLYLGDLPSQFVASIEMEMDGQTFRDFSQSVENEWVSELTDLEWKRSVKQCRCTVHTNEVPAQQFTFNATVQFTPLPPVLQSTTPTDQVVKEAAFRYAADVKSPSSQKTDLRVLLNGRPLDPATVNEEGARIERDLELQPGDNVIEVLARNEGARPETHEIETTRSVTRVTYQKAKALPPKIVVDRFEVFDKKTGNWSPVSQDEQEKSLIVTQPKFRVHGTIRAAESPSSAHWSHEKPGAAAARQPLALEKNGDAKVWQFTQACDLNPGGQQLNFYARSADSDEASWPLRVEFRPLLPQIQWDDSVASGSVEREAHEPPATIALSGKLVLPDPRHPFEAEILINDQPVGPPDIDLERAVFKAKVPLRSGENRIQVTMKNQWQATAASEIRVFQYRRLPRILSAANTPVVREPFTEVTAKIECPADRELTQVTIGDLTLNPTSVRQVEKGQEVAVWEAKASIPLQPGKNRIRVSAATADGRSRTDTTLDINYDAAFWRPATLEFANSAPSENVTTDSYELAFQIRSPSTLRNTRIEVDGAAVAEDQLKKADEKVAGLNQSKVTANLRLKEGVNRVVVKVQNEGGEVRSERQLNYVPPPVRLQIVSLEPEEDSTKAIRPVIKQDGRPAFLQPITSGQARLRGKVQWHRPNADPRAAATEIRIWVNGFQQEPISLKRSQGEQDFSTLVVLGESKQNLINVDLAGAALDGQSRVTFTVDCLKPQAAQRLHLLVIGADQTDPSAIRQRALKAVRAEVDSQGNFLEPLRTAGFQRVNVYRPLIQNVTFSDVFRLLLRVKADLKIPVGPDPSGKPMAINDVVMVYYEGGFLVPEKQHFVLCTSERFDANNRYSAIASDWLATFFDSMRGAQLAFLDVKTDKPPTNIPVADWNHDSHAALLCYAWRKGFVPPDDRRLLKAVDVALANAGRLGELDVELAKFSVSSPELDYSRIVPERLKSLVLSRN